MPRPQLRFLPGSRWTSRGALPDSEGERHFEVLEVRGAGRRGPGGRGGRDATAAQDAQVVMRAVLTARRYLVPVRDLADDARWCAGWLSLPAAPAEP